MRKDKIIAFERDVIRLAAEESEYSETEIKTAYTAFCVSMREAMSANKYTRLDIPIGILYLDSKKMKKVRPKTPLGFCKPEGYLADIINSMKSEMGLTMDWKGRRKHSGHFSVMNKIKMHPSKIEEWQNEDFENIKK